MVQAVALRLAQDLELCVETTDESEVRELKDERNRKEEGVGLRLEGEGLFSKVIVD